MIQGIHHTAITVLDWDRSMEFYCDTLGMECVWEVEFEENDEAKKIHAVDREHVRVGFLTIPGELGGGMIEMFEFEEPETVPPKNRARIHDAGWTHVCFGTDDIEETYRSLKADGVEFTTPPITVGPEGATIHKAPQTDSGPQIGRVKATYFYDPDERILELIEL